MRPTDAKGKDYKRAPLGELKINDQDAVGLQISRKGRPDVNIYFAKKTGLPLKCEVRSLDGLEANKEVIHELLMTEYKKFGDLKMFTKLVWNKDGKRYLERELAEVKAEESLDADLFAKP
jgi:guanylate kinase